MFSHKRILEMEKLVGGEKQKGNEDDEEEDAHSDSEYS